MTQPNKELLVELEDSNKIAAQNEAPVMHIKLA